MQRAGFFLSGAFFGIALVLLAIVLQIYFLADFLVVKNESQSADAIVILGGDVDGTRLKAGVRLFDQGLAPRLMLTGMKKERWLQLAQKFCPDCRLSERPATFIEVTKATNGDALASLNYCRENGMRKILVVTSPYHTRRSQLVFNDVFQGRDISPIIISSGDYGRLVSPDGLWWHHRPTVETMWLEFGKILYWELTPFKEFQGDEG